MNNEAMKKEVPLPAIIGAVVVLVALIAWYGYKVMNKSQEGVTPPAEARRMMMEYMKRGGSPGRPGSGGPPQQPQAGR
jgi:hypothetical protein